MELQGQTPAEQPAREESSLTEATSFASQMSPELSQPITDSANPDSDSSSSSQAAEEELEAHQATMKTEEARLVSVDNEPEPKEQQQTAENEAVQQEDQAENTNSDQPEPSSEKDERGHESAAIEAEGEQQQQQQPQQVEGEAEKTSDELADEPADPVEELPSAPADAGNSGEPAESEHLHEQEPEPADEPEPQPEPEKPDELHVEPPEQPETEAGQDECKGSEADAEALGQQVAEADKLVAQQIESVLSMESSLTRLAHGDQEAGYYEGNDVSSPTCSSSSEPLSTVSISSVSHSSGSEPEPELEPEVEPLSSEKPKLEPKPELDLKQVPEVTANGGEEILLAPLDATKDSDVEPDFKVPDDQKSSNADIDQDLSEEDDGGVSDDFCSEPASKQNLRRLKMDASEDVLVCEQNRESLEAARSMFETLSRQLDRRQQAQSHKRKQAARKAANQQKAASIQRSGSLSGQNTPDNEDNEEEEDEVDYVAASGATGRAQVEKVGEENNNENNRELQEKSLDGKTLRPGEPDDDTYDIKIIKRSGSSLSSAGFRRTLVCSVSPTSQLGSSPDMSLQEQASAYPIDGDEMLQCKVAFRENKRLIERHQGTVVQQDGGDFYAPDKLLSPTQGAGEAQNTWTLRNQKNLTPTNCTHCKQKLYPVDRMELDFTKTTLNIHRNCFKCQVCSTMLRLETYAAIDAKLYCPAHVKCVAIQAVSRERVAANVQ